MHTRPFRAARWWTQVLVVPALAATLTAASGTVAYAAAEDTEPPGAPGRATLVDYTSGRASLTWAPSTDNVGVTSYDVLWGHSDVVSPYTVTTNRVVVSGSPSRSYTFTARAVDAAGNRSAWSPTVRLTMPPGDSEPPTSPDPLIVGSVGETTVGLSWATSTDNIAVLGYDVLSITPGGSTVVARVDVRPPGFPPAPTSASVTGLTPRTEYTFAVRAEDEAGNYSALTDLVTVTTGPAPEPPPNCVVRRVAASEWPGGVSVTMAVRNTRPTVINGWTLSWAFPDGNPLSLFGAELVRRGGGSVTVRDARYNAVIDPGGAVYLGFFSTPPLMTPSRYVLNGQPCQLG